MKTKQPLVSVITTSFNYGRYIGQTIKSVLDQTYDRWELIVVDDASTDDSIDVIRAINDARIRLIPFRQNRGYGVCYEVALAESRGEYVASVDSDDYLAPGKLARQVHYLETHPELDILGTFIRHVDAKGRVVEGGKSVAWFNVDKDLNDPATWIWNNRLCHSSVLMRRAVHEKVGTFDNSLFYTPDWDFWIRCLSKKMRFHVMPEQLTFYRDHGKNITARFPERSYWEYAFISARVFHPYLVTKKRLDLIDTNIGGFVRHPIYWKLGPAQEQLFELFTHPPGEGIDFGVFWKRLRKAKPIISSISSGLLKTQFEQRMLLGEQLAEMERNSNLIWQESQRAWKERELTSQKLVEKEKLLAEKEKKLNEVWQESQRAWKERELTNQKLVEKEKLLAEKEKKLNEVWQESQRAWKERELVNLRLVEREKLLAEKEKKLNEVWQESQRAWKERESLNQKLVDKEWALAEQERKLNEMWESSQKAWKEKELSDKHLLEHEQLLIEQNRKLGEIWQESQRAWKERELTNQKLVEKEKLLAEKEKKLNELWQESQRAWKERELVNLRLVEREKLLAEKEKKLNEVWQESQRAWKERESASQSALDKERLLSEQGEKLNELWKESQKAWKERECLNQRLLEKERFVADQERRLNHIWQESQRVWRERESLNQKLVENAQLLAEREQRFTELWQELQKAKKESDEASVQLASYQQKAGTLTANLQEARERIGSLTDQSEDLKNEIRLKDDQLQSTIHSLEYRIGLAFRDACSSPLKLVGFPFRLLSFLRVHFATRKEERSRTSK